MTSVSNEKPPPKKRFVVSSFICRRTGKAGELQVSIFKRSDQVRSYKSKWAACSGSIDPTDVNPLAAAWRELEEETTLDASDLTFLRAGKQYSIVDDELNTEWTIYAFAFLLQPGAKEITIDWEHTEYRFIRPEELKSFDTVPHLGASLWRVVLSPELAEGLKALRDDHENGARVLATNALEILRSVGGGGGTLDGIHTVDECWRELRMTGWHIAKDGRPSMGAAITSVVLDAFDKIAAEATQQQDVGGFKRRVSDILERMAQERSLTPDRMAMQFQQYLKTSDRTAPCRILTLSSSSTIRHCLIHLVTEIPHITLELSILESRPLFEGVSMAHFILTSLKSHSADAASRVKITLAPDGAAAILAQDADIVLIGADRVSGQGDVSNKTGSLPAVAAAKTLSNDIDVVVLSEAEKIASPQSQDEASGHDREDNDAQEVMRAWPMRSEQVHELHGETVKVLNVYFEWVPSSLIDAYICEDGVLNVAQIQERSRRIAELEEKIWGDI